MHLRQRKGMLSNYFAFSRHDHLQPGRSFQARSLRGVRSFIGHLFRQSRFLGRDEGHSFGMLGIAPEDGDDVCQVQF